jgi:hypothetical protein
LAGSGHKTLSNSMMNEKPINAAEKAYATDHPKPLASNATIQNELRTKICTILQPLVSSASLSR